MGVLLNDAASEYLAASQTGVSASGLPSSVSAWYNTDDVAVTQQTIFTITDISADPATDFIILERRGSGTGDANKIACVHISKTAKSTAGDGGGANEWHQAGCVAANSTSLYAYLDGVPGAIDATDITPSGLDTSVVGAFKIAPATLYYWSGILAEVGVWNVALTTIEMAMLAAGYSPLFIRPASLVNYWPLMAAWGTPNSGDYMDLMTGTMFDVNTDGLDDEHPRIIHPSSNRLIHEGDIDYLGAAAYRRQINRGIGFGVFR